MLLADLISDDYVNDHIVHRTERYTASIFLQKLKDQVCQKPKVKDDKTTLLDDKNSLLRVRRFWTFITPEDFFIVGRSFLDISNIRVFLTRRLKQFGISSTVDSLLGGTFFF